MERRDKINYYLDLAEAVAQRSTCLRRHFGAVIVKDDEVISTGYSGAPRGRENCTDLNYCVRTRLNVPRGERYELCEAVHAEMNACINGNPVDLAGATIYIAGVNIDGTEASGKPCMMCARVIKNAQIEKVVFKDKEGNIRYE